MSSREKQLKKSGLIQTFLNILRRCECFVKLNKSYKFIMCFPIGSLIFFEKNTLRQCAGCNERKFRTRSGQVSERVAMDPYIAY